MVGPAALIGRCARACVAAGCPRRRPIPVADGVPAARTIYGGTNPPGTPLFGVPGALPKDQDPEQPEGQIDGHYLLPPLTLAATHSGAGKEGFAHIWRDEFQARIPPLILDRSVNISRLVSLLEGSSSDPAQNSEDLTALACHHRAVGSKPPPCCGVPGSGPFWKPGPLVPPGPADCLDQGSS